MDLAGRDRRFLLVAGAVFLALSLAFLPETYLISDEASYLALATTFLRGHVHPDLAHVSIVEAWQDSAGHLVAKHPPGNAAYLVPFLALGGVRAAFLAMPLAHLVGMVLAARLFKALGRDPRLAVLYLFHPTAVLFARTVMSDVLAATCALLAISEIARKRPGFLAGLGLGLLVLVRPPEVVVAAAIGLAGVLGEGRTAGRRAALRCAGRLAAGALPGILLLAGYLALTTGNPLVLPYEKVGAGGSLFALANVPGNLVFYGLALLAVPPLLLGAAALDRPYRALLVLPVVASIALYAAYGWLDVGGSRVESFVRGLRFHLPVLALLLASYARFLESLVPERWRAKLPWALLCVLAAGAAAISVVHERRVRERAQLAKVLLDATPDDAVICANDTAAKIFQSLGSGHREVREWGFIHLADRSKPIYIAQLEEDARPERVVLAREWTLFILSVSRGHPVGASVVRSGPEVLRVEKIAFFR